MRRTGLAIGGLILCVALAASPAFVELAAEDGRPFETPLPAESEERLSDPEIEERNRTEAHKDAPFFSSDREASLAHCGTRPAGPPALRHDDPAGSSSHGLRAPPV